MNILNIFNNLVTLSTPHNPTHTLPKQPQCSYKYNVYQYVVPTLQGNPPMSAASEESTAGFSPEAPQTGKKGDRAAETGRQKRAAETGGKNGAAETGRQEADAGERAEGTGSRRLASKKAGQEHRKTEYGQEKPETEHKNPKTGRESPETGRGAGCRRDRHSESEADRAGTKQKKETRNQD